MVKMRILGITDAKDCGAVILEGSKILAAVNEERLSRVKLESGFPYRSIAEVMRLSKTKPDQISAIAVAGIMSPFVMTRLLRTFQEHEDKVLDDPQRRDARSIMSDLLKYRLRVTETKPASCAGRIGKQFVEKIIRKDLPQSLRGTPLLLVDHHLAHAASAYYTSGKNVALCFTSDGYGDGVSMTVNLCRNGQIFRLYEADAKDSLGTFYSLITILLGFKPHRHEGKITGLAAFGKAENVAMAFPFVVNNGRVNYTGIEGHSGEKWLKQKIGKLPREDVAAWVQKGTEEAIHKMVNHWTGKTKVYDIILAGGVFSNVCVNQKVYESRNVKSVYIFPHMGDGGLAAGAAFAYLRPKNVRLQSVYLGRGYTDKDIKSELDAFNLHYEHYHPIEPKIAELLSEGKVVGRFSGSMEYGPRALGNRSIICEAKRKEVNDWLNKRLKRSEFMPFAPSTLAEYAKKCYKNIDGISHALTFMTITVDCTDWMKEHCPAVVHVDGTARPQLVHKEINPSYYTVLSEYNKITGIPTIVNTSYNMHEEPIVASPNDAIRSFLSGKLDFLAIGNYLAYQK